MAPPCSLYSRTESSCGYRSAKLYALFSYERQPSVTDFVSGTAPSMFDIVGRTSVGWILDHGASLSDDPPPKKTAAARAPIMTSATTEIIMMFFCIMFELCYRNGSLEVAKTLIPNHMPCCFVIASLYFDCKLQN